MHPNRKFSTQKGGKNGNKKGYGHRDNDGVIVANHGSYHIAAKGLLGGAEAAMRHNVNPHRDTHRLLVAGFAGG